MAVPPAVLVCSYMLGLGSCRPLVRLRMHLRCEESLRSQVAFACLQAARLVNLPVSLAEQSRPALKVCPPVGVLHAFHAVSESSREGVWS